MFSVLLSAFLVTASKNVCSGQVCEHTANVAISFYLFPPPRAYGYSDIACVVCRECSAQLGGGGVVTRFA